jgi:hypothetical protein
MTPSPKFAEDLFFKSASNSGYYKVVLSRVSDPFFIKSCDQLFLTVNWSDFSPFKFNGTGTSNKKIYIKHRYDFTTFYLYLAFLTFPFLNFL